MSRLRIKEIEYRYTDTSDGYESADELTVFDVGREIKFKVRVENTGNDDSPEYTVSVYDDKNDDRLDHDSEPSIEPGEINSAYLYVTINNSGKRSLGFEIKRDDDSDYTYATISFIWGTESQESQLEIKNILYRYADTSDDYKKVEQGTVFEVGREVKFKIGVKNVGDEESPRYTVFVSDDDFNKIDDDSEPSVDPGDVKYAYLYVTINTPGYYPLIFEVKPDKGKYTNGFYMKLYWGDGQGSGVTWEDLGCYNYLRMIENIEENMSATDALNWMKADLQTCAFKENLDLFKGKTSHFDNFCDKFNELVLKSGLVAYEEAQTGKGDLYYTYRIDDEFEEIHYARNLLNKVPSTLEELIQEKSHWEMLPYYKAAFHMNGEEGIFNLKFVSKDGQHHEAVYDYEGNLVTDDLNMGTYNFVGPNNADGHIMYDVETYYKWGNTKNTDGRGQTRELLSAGANIIRLAQNKEAKRWYNNYAELFNVITVASDGDLEEVVPC